MSDVAVPPDPGRDGGWIPPLCDGRAEVLPLWVERVGEVLGGRLAAAEWTRECGDLYGALVKGLTTAGVDLAAGG